MSQYDLRSAFPMIGQELVVRGVRWKCELAEVSDLRPGADRLSWYVVFEAQQTQPRSGSPQPVRKLEIVTSADHLLRSGWGDDLQERLVEWLMSDEQDGRQEWLDK